jgi:DNA-binding transcriptional regulator YiaG
MAHFVFELEHDCCGLTEQCQASSSPDEFGLAFYSTGVLLSEIKADLRKRHRRACVMNVGLDAIKGPHLGQLRRMAVLTRQQVADRAGISVSRLSSYEDGTIRPGPGETAGVVAAIGDLAAEMEAELALVS